MIKSFKNKDTEKLWRGERVKKIPTDIQERALKKLFMIHVSNELDDLRNPPGNRLEQLSGDRKEYMSIRINKQWRICFRWEENNAFEVEIIDYH